MYIFYACVYREFHFKKERWFGLFTRDIKVGQKNAYAISEDGEHVKNKYRISDTIR